MTSQVIFAHTRRAVVLLALLSLACATAPRPAAETLALAANARATVEGRVTDRQGRPIAAIRVQGLPREEGVGWEEPVLTDSEGRFRLSLVAPARYGFLLSWQGRTVVTPDKDDPARLDVAVTPGETRRGIRVLFLPEEWEKVP